MSRARQRRILAAWAALLLVCAVVVARTHFRHDLSAFLPRSPSAEQQILVEQLREGVVSRLILVGIEGAEVAALAAASKRLASALRNDSQFVSADNGEPAFSSGDRDVLWHNRYLLSPATSAARFSTAGLRESLETDLELLASPAAGFVTRTLGNDPSGELLRLLEQVVPQTGPAMRLGVWFTQDGKRALLVVQTRARGSDIDAQESALTFIRNAFSRADAGDAKLVMAGAGVFSVMARDRIRSDAWRLSLAGTVLIGGLLLGLYRSSRMLVLGLLPVASGALAGIAAVSLGFGSVHGITLGFGVTLIGEGVDYAIYLFAQKSPDNAAQTTFNRIWPTLRLGVATSVCGFSAMLLSGFTGLAQLGLFSMVGLVVAAAVTRWVLPPLIPAAFSVRAVGALAQRTLVALRMAPRLAPAALVVLAAAALLLVTRPAELWSTDLASLSPVLARDRLLDQELRRSLGAPDIGYLVVVNAQSDEGALQAAERVTPALEEAMRRNELEGFDSPALYLPSRQTQLARRTALPEPEVLRTRLNEAAKGLPFRRGLFAPFVEDVAAAKSAAPLQRSDLEGSRLALKVDALLLRRGSGWSAILPLRGVKDADAIARRVAAVPETAATMLDLKRASDALYRSYLGEARKLALGGAAAIIVLLFASLRAPRRVFDVVAPLAAAVIADAAIFAAFGEPLTIFHLVGLLLVVAVGSNYSLFFDRLPLSEAERGRTLVSLAFAVASTLIGFGVLAFSSVLVLHAIGTTVAIGALLALIFSAVFSRHASAD